MIGVRHYPYEPRGDAQVFFEQFAVPLGTREIVMYNKLDEHAFPGHDSDLLRWTPAQLAARSGHHALHDAASRHWKYSWFDWRAAVRARVPPATRGRHAMTLDRREVIAGGGALAASCASLPRPSRAHRAVSLDELLEANAAVLPENAGGANHYPMAAETLEALGRPELIEEPWRAGAASYAGAAPRVAPIADVSEALGDYARYGDWLDLFRGELAREPWRTVVARWAPRLAPGVSAAVFHGLIRTAHVVRSLRRRESGERLAELAVGLAYWAARYAELPPAPGGPELRTPLTQLAHPWLAELDDVPFDAVHARLARAPIAPRVTLAGADASLPPVRDVPADLDALVREAAGAFLAMLVLERHRLWLLHTVTGPAAAALLVPDLDPQGARALAAYSRQAVVALYIAFGAPYRPGAHLRATPPWPELTRRAAESRSVHTIKLVEALSRHRHVDDSLCRSVAAQWFEWT